MQLMLAVSFPSTCHSGLIYSGNNILIALSLSVIETLLSRFHLVLCQSTAVSIDILKMRERKKLRDFCNTQMEDEFHCVCICPLYKSLRIKYISSDMRKRDTFTRFFFCNERNIMGARCVSFSRL